MPSKWGHFSFKYPVFYFRYLLLVLYLFVPLSYQRVENVLICTLNPFLGEKMAQTEHCKKNGGLPGTKTAK